MAIKPYLSAIMWPTKKPVLNKEKPDQSYEIDFVYGYKCEEVRQNLFYNSKRRPVYMTAAIGVILDAKSRK